MFNDNVGLKLGAVVLVSAVLGGCDQLGLETPAKMAEKSAAEARAVGSACRHAMRAIEDCYLLNPKADKASVFAGWREMDEYMRENKLEGVAPQVPRPAPKASSTPEDDDEVIDEAEEASPTEKRDSLEANTAASAAKASPKEKAHGKGEPQEALKGASKPR